MKKITLNRNQFYISVAAPLVQGDLNAYTIVYPRVAGDGITGIEVEALRADQVAITDVGAVYPDRCEYTLKTNMYDVPGEVLVRVSLLGEDQKYTINELRFEAVADYKGDEETADDRIPALTTIILQASEAAAYAQDQGAIANAAAANATAQAQAALTAADRANAAAEAAEAAGSGLPDAIQIVEFTGAATDIDVFINAYNALPATGGTLVLVGNGNIQITESQYIPILTKPTTIIGYGAKMSIKNNGNSETSAITTSSDLIMLGGTYTISAGSQPITLISGGYIMSTGGIMMQDCMINNSGTKGTAIYLEQASYYKIINCKITYTGTGSNGIYITTPGSSNGVIRDCEISSASSITTYDLSELQIINNKIWGNASFGGGLSVDNISIIGNKWESGTCSLTAMDAAYVFVNGNYGTADFTSWANVSGVTLGQNYIMEVV